LVLASLLIGAPTLQAQAPEAPPAPENAWPEPAPQPEAPPAVSALTETSPLRAPVIAQAEGPADSRSQEKYESGMLSSTLLISVGYGTALVTGAVALGSHYMAERVAYWHAGDTWQGELDVDGSGVIDSTDERIFRSSARAFTVLSGIGLILGVTGSVLLAQTLREARIDTQNRRASPGQTRGRREWSYSAGASAHGAGLWLGARF
jgi:hypothetical protein